MLSKSTEQEILRRLAAHYPNPTTALHHTTPFQLLVATILSAQCTDERVNIITKELFACCPTPQAMNDLSEADIAGFIRSAGLWQAKAKNIKAACALLLEKHGGCVPKTREELMALPGVGRKTANVVLANAFGIPALAVDTHVQRTANRLGLAASKNPDKVEQQLMKIIPEADWIDAHHWLIYHGRQICRARSPLCHQCFLMDICPSAADFLDNATDQWKEKPKVQRQ